MAIPQSAVFLVAVVILATTGMSLLVLLLYMRERKRSKSPTQSGTLTPLNKLWASLKGSRIPGAQTKGEVRNAPARSKPISELQGRVGRNSKVAGIGFAALTVGLLVLSAATQYIVYEVDSIVAFVAAVLLLFRDPHARVQARVLDAILLSSNQAMKDLSALEGSVFAYIPSGNTAKDVVVVERHSGKTGMPRGLKPESSVEVVPPGRALAELFSREAGLTHLTLETVGAFLPRILKDNFGLADSVAINSTGDVVEVVMRGSAVDCGCEVDSSRTATGTIGCTVASFLAILVSASTGRPVLLGACTRNAKATSWIVPMTLEPVWATMIYR